MSNGANKKDGDNSPDNPSELRKAESGNLSGLIKIDPKLLKEIPNTNAHSGSAGGNQDESIGIDFGNGKVASRQNKLTEASAKGTESPTAKPDPPPRVPELPLPPPPPPAPQPRPIHFDNLPLPSPVLAQNRDILNADVLKSAPKTFQELKDPPRPPANAPELLKVKEVQTASEQIAKPKDPLFAPIELINKRIELESLVQKKIANPKEREQFLADMRKFESDFKDRSTKSEADKQFEMANTYAQLSRLLNADNDVLSRYPQCKQASGETPWRIQAAEQIMHQAAEPTSVDQGVLAVCPTAALQVRQYWRDPSAVARLVTDVLLTGSYKATTGDKKIDVTQCPDNLIPDVFARHFSIEKQIKGESVHLWEGNYTGIRSFASQIFDVTATGMALASKGYRFEQPPYKRAEDKLAYAQAVAVSSTGERISWDDAIKRHISVKDNEIPILNELITGKRETGFLILGAPLTESEGKDHNNRKFLDFVSREASPRYLYSSSELGITLKRVKESDQWPPITAVNTSTRPFSVKGGGSHFITVTGISTDTSKVAFDNTWGKEKDKNGPPQIDTAELAKSIRSEAENLASQASTLAPLVSYRLNHSSNWKSLVQSWLTLAEKTRNDPKPEIAIAEHKKAMQDNILQDWLTKHPQDRNLKLWHTTLLEWLSKYQDELK